jgi:hypothetical protein
MTSLKNRVMVALANMDPGERTSAYLLAMLAVTGAIAGLVQLVSSINVTPVYRAFGGDVFIRETCAKWAAELISVHEATDRLGLPKIDMKPYQVGGFCNAYTR